MPGSPLCGAVVEGGEDEFEVEVGGAERAQLVEAVEHLVAVEGRPTLGGPAEG